MMQLLQTAGVCIGRLRNPLAPVANSLMAWHTVTSVYMAQQVH